jgi:hypothetical protein
MAIPGSIVGLALGPVWLQGLNQFLRFALIEQQMF